MVQWRSYYIVFRRIWFLWLDILTEVSVDFLYQTFRNIWDNKCIYTCCLGFVPRPRHKILSHLILHLIKSACDNDYEILLTILRLHASGMHCCVVWWIGTSVSEEPATSIFRVEDWKIYGSVPLSLSGKSYYGVLQDCSLSTVLWSQ